MALTERALLEVLVDIQKSLAGIGELRAQWDSQTAAMQASAEAVEPPPTTQAVAEASVRAQQAIKTEAEHAAETQKVFDNLRAEIDEKSAEQQARLDAHGEKLKEWREEVDKSKESVAGLSPEVVELGIKLAAGALAVNIAKEALRQLTDQVAGFGEELGASDETLARFKESMGALSSPAGVLKVPALIFGELRDSVRDFFTETEMGIGLLAGLAKVIPVPILQDLADLLPTLSRDTRIAAEAAADQAEAEKRRAESLAELREQVRGNIPELLEQAQNIAKLRQEIEAAGASESHLRNLAERAKTLVEEFERVGQEAPKHLRDLVAAFQEIDEVETADLLHEVTEEEEALEKQAPATSKAIRDQGEAFKDLDKQLDATIAQLRATRQELRQAVADQRDAGGIDELERSTQGLREEIEKLEAADFRTIEQENRIDQAKQDLIDTERKLQDALSDTNLFYDEHNLATAEAELAAAEYEKRQRALKEAMGETGDSFGEASGELGDYGDEQERSRTETEKQIEATKTLVEQLEALKEKTAELRAVIVAEARGAAKEVGDAWQEPWDRFFENAERAKQCMVDLQGATDAT